MKLDLNPVFPFGAVLSVPQLKLQVRQFPWIATNGQWDDVIQFVVSHMRFVDSRFAYQRGMTGVIEAAQAKEFIYVNIVHRNETAPSTERWAASQDQDLLAKDPSAKLTYNDGPSRKGARTRIRRFESASYPAIEITGFLEFEEFIGQFVMFTQVVAESRNMRKLNHLLRHAQPLNVSHGQGDAPQDTDQHAYVHVLLDVLPEDSE